VTEFDAMSAAAAGMDAQRIALNVAARNVAAAEAGGDFARLIPRFAVSLEDGPADAGLGGESPRFDGADFGDAPDEGTGLVRFIGTTEVPGTSPDSITEMVSVLNAERAYEANASVFEAGKRLAERTIDAGRA
jgi:flagellar basal-body rod protein FlgC